MTIEDLIRRLAIAGEESPLGWDTVVCLCEPETEYQEITGTILDIDPDGATFLIQVRQ